METQEVVATGVGQLSVHDKSGDTRLMWNRDNADEVKAARDHFDVMKKKGYLAYTVEGREGTKGTVIDRFDPNAERIIMSPRPIGG